jgi:hypothetical protein
MNTQIPLRLARRKLNAKRFFLPIPTSINILLQTSLSFVFLLVSAAAFSQIATKVVLTQQPVFSHTNGALMTVQPVVEIRDAGDVKVSTSTAQVEIVIASGTGGTLGGTTRINAVNGVATFTDLSFSGVNNQSYTFQFNSSPVIVTEPFAYGAGTLTGNTGGTGWSGAWYGPNGAFTDLNVNTTGFTYPNYSTTGGRATYISSTGGDGARALAASSNAKYNVVWLSFIGNYTVQGGGFSNVRLYLPAGLSGAVGGNAGINNWSILNSGLNNTVQSTVPLDGTTRLALLKVDYLAGTSSLWMDPDVNTFDGTQTPSMTETFAPVFDRIELYNRTTGVGTDELTLASTYKAALHLEQNLTSDVSLAVLLPVKWNYFTASCKGNYTLLQWGTTSEYRNSHFIVEKKTTAADWLPIGKILSSGNDGVDHKYEFTDSINASKSNYRLRQVDIDGAVNYSKIIASNCQINGNEKLHVYPNPASDHLQITGGKIGSEFQLIDAKGNVVKKGIVRSSTTTILLSGLPTGTYFLKLPPGKTVPVQVVKGG